MHSFIQKSFSTASINDPYITLTDLSGSHQFSPGNIIRLEANDNYTVVHFQGRRPFVVSKVLKIYEEMLRPFGFIRTHRSHLVNKQYVQRIEKTTLIMQDASVAEVCRRKAKTVRQLLEAGIMSQAS